MALRVLDPRGCPYASAEEAIRYRLETALRARERSGLRETRSYRLVNSDGDLLSGLIVDVFSEEVAVLQSSSLAIDAHINYIADRVAELTGARNIYEKSTQRSRRDIGLEPRRRWIRGRRRRVIVEEGQARFLVDVEMGQKTGFYLDQRPNRLELEKMVSPGDTVLDVFSYTGGFGIHAALAGAKRVVFVEEDPQAVSLLRENLSLNGISRYEIVEASVWEAQSSLKGEFDTVIVDPPAFIQSGDEASVRRGVRAYKRVYSWALGLIGNEGLAYLSSCSYFLTRDLFVEVLSASMYRAGLEYTLLGGLRGAGADHVLRTAEYLEYLKGAFAYAWRLKTTRKRDPAQVSTRPTR